ncbi:MAG: ATP-binding protein [Treponema sp.]|nr:ATP-binding protein [Treponema sp.]
MLIRKKILLVIITAMVIVSGSSLAVGALFLSGGFNNLLIVGAITLAISAAAAALISAVVKRFYEKIERLRESAETMSELKSKFIATISHEIRTPMSNIVGFSELAITEENNYKVKDFLNKIKNNAEWLMQIINDILDISRAEYGNLALENIPFDMHDLLSSCRSLLMPKAEEKGLTLYFYVEPSIGKKPLGDPARLRQVLVNLLSNAIKFTNTGMIKLHAVVREMTERTITMRFEVKDSGIGMSCEQVNKIFDPYAPDDIGKTRRFGGTGLGLAITKNLVEMMGGTLHVDSAPGIGSKFSFEIVFDTIDVQDDDLMREKILFNELEKPKFDAEILLFEDNYMNQQVISEHLKRVGVTTVVAENGKVGLDIIKKRIEKNEKLFDLIFMDMHMPVMDGLEASMHITEMNIGIPIVAMTANVIYNDKEIYKKNGMNDCVGKPFTSQELWRCLMKYLTPKL